MRNLESWRVMAAAAVLALGGFATASFAQGTQAQPAGTQSQPQGAQAQGQPAGQAAAPEQPPVSKEEEDAYRAFYALQTAQIQETITQGEDFLAKYPNSRYRPSVYSRVVAAYLNKGDKDKIVETSRKALAEDPNNVDVLAIACTVIPRTVDSKSLDADQKLTDAETYAKRAIQLVNAMTKPDALTDEQFASFKNEKLGMAHFGLGLVYYMRGNSAASVPELDQASKLDPQPEPLLFYLLGTGDMKLKNYTDATTAFDRCAKAKWDPQWQARCKSREDEAKQAAASAPKP